MNAAIVSAQNLAKVAQSNIAAFQSLADIALNASEQFFALNIDAARSACAQAAASAAPVLDGDLQQQVASRINTQGKALEQVVGYLRGVNDLNVRTQGELSAFGTQRIEDASREVGEFLDQCASSAPAGVNEFLVSLKSALTNATTAYQNFVKTSRDVAESNIAAASNAMEPLLTAPAGTRSRKVA